MTYRILTLLGLSACGLACAQEVGTVVSSTPVIQQVAVPQQVCSQESVLVPQSYGGGGAVLGAIAGGAIGNAIGHGGGRALGTMIGIVGGAVVGDRIESHGGSQLQQVQHCTTRMVLENRVLHYDVVYTYAGRQYAVQLARDPGPTVLLQIMPVDAVTPPPIALAPPMLEAPAITRIDFGVQYVPFMAYQAPIFIAPPLRTYGHARHPNYAPHRSGRHQDRHPGAGRDRHWR